MVFLFPRRWHALRSWFSVSCASPHVDSTPQQEQHMTLHDASSAPGQCHFCTETNEVSDPCHAQWLLMYTTAAYASEIPDAAERNALYTFFTKFPDQCVGGPAGNCYTEAVKATPPPVESRRALMLWLCSIENRCRRAAGMPVRLCRYESLLRRWRGGADDS